MNSIQRIIEAFGGMAALRKNGWITVRQENRQLDITHLRYGIRLGESIRVIQSTDGKTDREMHFEVTGEIWLPYFFRIPEEVEVIIHNADENGRLQTDAFLQACLEDHARVWDMALFREGFDRIGLEQPFLPAFGVQA
jgi:VCBS repeat-containing protein